MSTELQSLGVLNGVRARSFQESLKQDRAKGMTDRALYDGWLLACVELRAGLRRVVIQDFAIRFVPIG